MDYHYVRLKFYFSSVDSHTKEISSRTFIVDLTEEPDVCV